MFTNWLTGTSSGAAANSSAGGGGGSGGGDNNAAAAAASAAVASLTLNSSSAAASSIMSTPPDVALEVGPAPSVRFVAHSIVLGMHSGYLRSAIRLDEHAAVVGDMVLYLGNVTAEQFAPLLTYMYTGYLDLNVENIFGVLLATHVLHMPRALEICRSFLARAQTEGYLGQNMPGMLPSVSNNAAATAAATNNGKIIRPIPSKATLPNYGFLPTPMAHQLPLPTAAAAVLATSVNPFKSLQQAYAEPMFAGHPTEASEEIDVVCSNTSKTAADNNDVDEDEEVFIDSNTETDTEIETEIEGSVSVAAATKLCVAQPPERAELLVLTPTPVEPPKAEKPRLPQHGRSNRSHHHHQHQQPPHNKPNSHKREKSNKQTRHNKSAASSSAASIPGLQIAKAPIPASQLDALEGTGSKFIVDVASCDGPVRFRRILNTAYGHKPDNFTVMPERTQQSVSYSFHQQMAKAISQQRQLKLADESENSESSGSGKLGGPKANANEIYVCVYCKHTFKSQYCYQKHAKRHLNPLSLHSSAAASTSGEACKLLAAESISAAAHSVPLPTVSSSHNSSGGGGGNKQSATELLRREVRPLDMNVQYYPCKTCGSKFPSYYFVHKHRKMCHADEEAAESGAGRAPGKAAAAENGASGGGGGSGSGDGSGSDTAGASGSGTGTGTGGKKLD